jgi:hypothetical protein
MNEQWRPVVGYEGFYEVSDSGRIKTVERVCLKRNGSKIKVKERIKSNTIGTHGYLVTGLKVSGKNKTCTVHRLVAIAFIDNPENLPCINHVDGVKTNNSLSNLEWCTIADNNTHAFDTGLNKIFPAGLHISFKGTIVATDTSTGKSIFMNGHAEIVSAGFDSSSVYKCVKGERGTHKSNTFTRLDK